MKQRITPFLWFDKEAAEAAKLYTSLFTGSEIENRTTLQKYTLGNGRDHNDQAVRPEVYPHERRPAFQVHPGHLFPCRLRHEGGSGCAVGKLSEGGTALMELGEYPFSQRYGWVQDRFGLSWQIMFMGGRKARQKITPTLMFVGDQCGKAEEAMDFTHRCSKIPRSAASSATAKVKGLIKRGR
ncbi:MAG: VOC family protein [Candidatus Micrarchaeia archaeon]